MIEKEFDIPFVAGIALREKQIQQNYRPIIAVHKWFARRPGTLFRSLLLAEFGQGSLPEKYFESNNLQGIRVADPFMGGGTPLLEANRLGCDIVGYDINPMAYWIVRQEIEHIDLAQYRQAANDLVNSLEDEIGHLYQTTCLHCGTDAHVKYFLWIKVRECQLCGEDIDLFPGYLLAEDQRHPKNVFVCPTCGELTETESRKNPGPCRSCGMQLSKSGPARRNRCVCRECGSINKYPDPTAGPPKHRMFALEYYCPKCKQQHQGRFFKKPDADDLAKYTAAETLLAQIEPVFIPDDEIPNGDETDRLHKWGYLCYRQMFNSRQLVGLELSCRAITQQSDDRIRNALSTNLSDLLRYQNMLCRYDTKALKSLDIFSVHGFPVGLVQCESNLLGISGRGRNSNVGSGGWLNIIEKYTKAKAYCDRPFEVQHTGSRKIRVVIDGEWIGDQRNNKGVFEHRDVQLFCASATSAELSPASLDAVVTDPPYFGNVQYAELMDFCYVWLRRLVGRFDEAFHSRSTRHDNELTGNITMDRDLSHFTTGLSEVFARMAQALKPGRPLAFTYHHNTLEAYYPIAVAILDAGLTCSASLPCPAEMGASIHINGTASSIVDTVFVCRSTGKVPRRWIAESLTEIMELVRDDVEQLRSGNVTLTLGDARCIAFGHVIRLVIWQLRHSWQRAASVGEKLRLVSNCVKDFGKVDTIEQYLGNEIASMKSRHVTTREERVFYGGPEDYVSF